MKTFTIFSVIATIGLAPAAYAQSSQTGSDEQSAMRSHDPRSVIPPEMAARYAHAKWTYPNPDYMQEHYPRLALQKDVQGAVMIVCSIAADGLLNQCAVAIEEPKGYGFGVTAADSFVRFSHVDPASVDGGIRPGDVAEFTFNWSLG